MHSLCTMNKDTELFSSVQQHLQGRRPPTDAPYEGRAGQDSDSVYQLEHANDGVYESGIMEPTRTGAYEVAPSYSRHPYLSAGMRDGNSVTSLPHYSPSHYAHEWGESDAELPLTKNGSTMNFAEDEYDEARQLHHPDHYGSPHKPTLSSNWMSSPHRDPYSTQPEQSGKFSWSNPELLRRQIDKRQLGIGRQSIPIVSWFLA